MRTIEARVNIKSKIKDAVKENFMRKLCLAGLNIMKYLPERYSHIINMCPVLSILNCKVEIELEDEPYEYNLSLIVLLLYQINQNQVS